MSLNDYIFCLIGKSGSGKTTIANKLFDKYRYTQIASYTTREPRNPNDTDHTYVSSQEFDKLTNMVAFTSFNGHRYCATKEQVDNANLYVIDPYGLEQLKQLYDGEKHIVSIYIDVPMDICLDRMRKRGDDEDKVWSRLRHDDDAFKGILDKCDFTINGNDEFAWYEVAKIINNVISTGTLKNRWELKKLYV